jgi:ABC-type dipeptide/oligopeptide/nickel transport system permease component
MWRFGLRQAGRLALGLFGAFLLAALVSALSVPNDGSVAGYLRDVLGRLSSMSQFDFGSSGISAAPAWTELAGRLPATLEILGLGAIFAAVVGAPVGILLSAGRALRAGAPLIQIVAAAPVFCAGLGLLWLSRNVLHWAGAPHEVSFLGALVSGNLDAAAAELRAAALPALTVGAAGAASIQLALRRAVNLAAGEPYRRGLHAMGLSRFEIDRLYLVPQVLAGLLQSLGEIASSLVAATAVAEWVFNWPGAADLFLRSVALRDWTVAGLILLALAALTMVAECVGTIGARLMAETERQP